MNERKNVADTNFKWENSGLGGQSKINRPLLVFILWVNLDFNSDSFN